MCRLEQEAAQKATLNAQKQQLALTLLEQKLAHYSRKTEEQQLAEQHHLQEKMQQAEQLSSQLFERLSNQRAGGNEWISRAQQVLQDAPIDVPTTPKAKRLSTVLAGLIVLMGVSSTSIVTDLVSPSKTQLVASNTTPVAAHSALKMSLNLSQAKR